MSKIRDVRIDEYVYVECCDHCHGEPRDCKDPSVPDVALHEVVQLFDRLLPVLDQHANYETGSARFRFECLRDDVRAFVRKHARLGMGV